MSHRHRQNISENQRRGIFPVTLGHPRLDALKALAAAQGVTVAEIVRQAVDAFLSPDVLSLRFSPAEASDARTLAIYTGTDVSTLLHDIAVAEVTRRLAQRLPTHAAPADQP